MERAFEPVHTIDVWYDGPRAGAADYHGVPHLYRSLYLDGEERDDDEDRFELIPITPPVLQCVLEDHRLWERWDAAGRPGDSRSASTHVDDRGSLAEDRARHAELRGRIQEYVTRTRDRAFIVRGEFSPDSTRVRWHAMED